VTGVQTCALPISVVVKDEMTGLERAVTAAPDMMATLKAGDKVKVSIGEEMAATEIAKVTEETKPEAAPDAAK
jgi:hypothetical protein